MAITILQLATHRLGRDAITGEDFTHVQLPILASCEVCQANILCSTAYPSMSGYVRCQRCIGNLGFQTVEDANRELFSEELYTVIDLSDDTSHGTYGTMEEARGCVSFDRLRAYAIWHGNVRVECCDAYRGDDDRAKQGLGEPNASESEG